jgi:hypothetical protein
MHDWVTVKLYLQKNKQWAEFGWGDHNFLISVTENLSESTYISRMQG